MTTLYINRTDSRCGACNRNADPAEPAHIMEKMVGEGCGAVFDSLASDYLSMKKYVVPMRPDLKWVGWDEPEG